MAEKNNNESSINSEIKNIQKLDATFHQMLKSDIQDINGTGKSDELSNVLNRYNQLITRDSYDFNRHKSISQSSYSHMANILVGKPLSSSDLKDPKKIKANNIENRVKMENLFNNGDMQMAGYFINQSSDMYHILDEIESICAYMYQLDEAINVLRDNVLNNEQCVTDLPFDITFDGIDQTKAAGYAKTIIDVWNETGMRQKLNDHIVPSTIKFGKYYVMTIPYSEIGVKMLSKDINQTHSLFDFGGSGYNDLGLSESSNQVPVDEAYTTCMESVDTILESLFNETELIHKLGDKETLKHNIEFNIKNLTISETPTPPNIIGISEGVFDGLSPDLKKEVEDAIKRNDKIFNANYITNSKKYNENKRFTDATIDTESIENIPGSFNKLLDPRVCIPIKIFEHTVGYYYFENYDYSRGNTSITDIMSNRMNFNDQNIVIDNLVGSILKRLKYGDILKSDNNFKSLIMNCILYAERRNNPIRIKFVPVEYITEFKTNCDPEGNGQPVLMKSLLFARLYISMLLFGVTSVITKSTDTEFYYLREGALTSTYQDQVADIIEQLRNSNIDISNILNGNLLHGNRAINKRYFMSTGTQDIKPFDMEVVSGQSIDLHTDFLNDLKKMAIGATGVPSVAIDYMDEIEFASILKMTNTKTLTRANNIQTDLNGAIDNGITGLVIKLTRFNKPNIIPEEDLLRCRCVLKKNNTINNNISSDEINNNIATVDNMVETYYKGQNTENPEIIEFEKEEMRKRLIMLLSRSLPWGEMEKMKNEVKIAARVRKEYNDLISNKAESNTSEA